MNAMMQVKRLNVVALAIAALSITPVWAQAQAPMPGMDHSKMPGMDHSKMPGMDHSKMPGMDHSEMPGMDHGAVPGMDHGSPSAPQPGMTGMGGGSGMTDRSAMQMQGGSAPPDARDPHANSGGHTLDSGPYVLPSTQRIRLADEHNFGALLVDRLERVDARDGNATAYEAQAWFGRDYDRLVFKAEGDIANGRLQEARTELLWGHAIATFWNTQLGMRQDSGVGPNREWLAFGVQGLAPYWFEVDATAYLGNNGRTAMRLDAEYELLLTQRLVLQPRLELNWYGKRDTALNLGSGLAEGTAGLRMRYEFTRQFAPYVGVEWARKFGETEDMARASGETTKETRWVAGVRFWF